jgi:hypothetical protein
MAALCVRFVRAHYWCRGHFYDENLLWHSIQNLPVVTSMLDTSYKRFSSADVNRQSTYCSISNN